MKEKWRQFWDWFKDRDPNESWWLYFRYSSRAKAAIITVVGFIVLVVVISLVLWAENYIRYHF